MTDREVQNEDLDSDEEENIFDKMLQKWSRTPEQSNIRTRSENVIRFLPG